LGIDGAYRYENANTGDFPTNLNAGYYWLSTDSLIGLSDTTSPGSSEPQAVFTFENPVLTDAYVTWGNYAGAVWEPENVSGTLQIPERFNVAEFSPAISYTQTDDFFTWRNFTNSRTGRINFTVPAGSPRSVTFTATAPYYHWRFQEGQIDMLYPLRSLTSNDNGGWTQSGGEWQAPWSASSETPTSPDTWVSKTLILNPGDYYLLINQVGSDIQDQIDAVRSQSGSISIGEDI
jgi:hypothetical protein